MFIALLRKFILLFYFRYDICYMIFPQFLDQYKKPLKQFRRRKYLNFEQQYGIRKRKERTC